jgi:hypothetical protein
MRDNGNLLEKIGDILKMAGRQNWQTTIVHSLTLTRK